MPNTNTNNLLFDGECFPPTLMETQRFTYGSPRTRLLRTLLHCIYSKSDSTADHFPWTNTPCFAVCILCAIAKDGFLSLSKNGFRSLSAQDIELNASMQKLVLDWYTGSSSVSTTKDQQYVERHKVLRGLFPTTWKTLGCSQRFERHCKRLMLLGDGR